MPLTVTLPDGYGYTVLVALGMIPVLGFAQGSVVTSLRAAAKVPYPNPYATADQVKNSKEAYKFNCAQRAHGNLLENMPQTMALLLFNGLFFPLTTPVLGLLWVGGRVLYAYGYVTSSMESRGGGRRIGGAFWLAQLGLLGLSVYNALQML